jgi:uncharacterized lipoprotein YajG
MRFVVFLFVLLAAFRLAGCIHPVKAQALANALNCAHVACMESRP